MYERTTNPVSVLLVLAVFAATTFLLPSSANAKWKDHSDNDGPDWGKIVAIGVVLGLASYGIAYLITHKKTEKAEPMETTEEDDTESAAVDETKSNNVTESLVSTSDFAPPMLSKQQNSQFGLYLDVDPPNSDNGFRDKDINLSDVTVKAGVSIRF